MAAPKSNQRSGAKARQQQREKEEAVDDAALASKRTARREATVRRDYRRVGKPPEDVVGRVEWSQRMMAVALHETATDPATAPRERRRVVGDLGAKIGLVAVKALYEQRLKLLEARVYGSRKKATNGAGDGLEEYKPSA